MPRAFVGVGSNIEPERNVAESIRRLSRQTRIVGISTVYLTEPEDRLEQPPYYNCVVEIETDLPPLDLKRRVLRMIEDDLGRRRVEDKYAPRTIDLDLLLYDDLVLDSEDLTLPHPLIRRRAFLAIPLSELAPDLILPGPGTPIRDLANALPRHSMQPLDSYTRELRGHLT